MRTARLLPAVFAMLFATAAAGQPVIAVVQDGAANTPDIAPGSIFIVKGTGLSGAGFVQNGVLPLPTALNDVQVSLTPAAGGAAVAAFMVNTFNQSGVNQVAALLPSTAAPGDYQLRLTNGMQTSAPFAVRVVAHKPGIVTANSSGSGQAQATTAGFELIRFATGELFGWNLRPVHPGDAVVLWATGLGADTASDPSGGSSGDRTAAFGVVVLVDGAEVTPFFAGRAANLPGTDQINFVLPANTRPDCLLRVQVRVGGVLSNPVTIAVAPPGSNVCENSRFSAEELRRFSMGEPVMQGLFDISTSLIESHFPGQEFPATRSEAFIGFVGGLTVNDVVVEGSSLPPGGCTAWRRVSKGSEIQFGQFSVDGLDLGSSIRVTPSGGAAIEAGRSPAGGGVYIGSWPMGGRQVSSGLQRIEAPGGADIAAFSAETTIPEFDWTNRGAITSLNRSQGLRIDWSGGAPGGVNIVGFGARLISGNPQNPAEAIFDAVMFSCWQDAGPGTFTVPTSILSQLPAVPAGSPMAGSLGVSAFHGAPGGRRFDVPLRAGGTVPGFFGFINGFNKNLTIQ